ncbi:MAG TPA: hypothetical protein VKU82_04315 [Planctomycetaceae bacterium]|nr:hypothetical protein [Planctomycetaceae bacterium]
MLGFGILGLDRAGAIGLRDFFAVFLDFLAGALVALLAAGRVGRFFLATFLLAAFFDLAPFLVDFIARFFAAFFLAIDVS